MYGGIPNGSKIGSAYKWVIHVTVCKVISLGLIDN